MDNKKMDSIVAREAEILKGDAIPKKYQDEYRQGIYGMNYINGRMDINRGSGISAEFIMGLVEEGMLGYLDGIRDERLFQIAEAKKEALN